MIYEIVKYDWFGVTYGGERVCTRDNVNASWPIINASHEYTISSYYTLYQKGGKFLFYITGGSIPSYHAYDWDADEGQRNIDILTSKKDVGAIKSVKVNGIQANPNNLMDAIPYKGSELKVKIDIYMDGGYGAAANALKNTLSITDLYRFYALGEHACVSPYRMTARKNGENVNIEWESADDGYMHGIIGYEIQHYIDGQWSRCGYIETNQKSGSYQIVSSSKLVRVKSVSGDNEKWNGKWIYANVDNGVFPYSFLRPRQFTSDIKSVKVDYGDYEAFNRNSPSVDYSGVTLSWQHPISMTGDPQYGEYTQENIKRYTLQLSQDDFSYVDYDEWKGKRYDDDGNVIREHDINHTIISGYSLHQPVLYSIPKTTQIKISDVQNLNEAINQNISKYRSVGRKEGRTFPSYIRIRAQYETDNGNFSGPWSVPLCLQLGRIEQDGYRLNIPNVQQLECLKLSGADTGHTPSKCSFPFFGRTPVFMVKPVKHGNRYGYSTDEYDENFYPAVYDCTDPAHVEEPSPGQQIEVLAKFASYGIKFYKYNKYGKKETASGAVNDMGEFRLCFRSPVNNSVFITKNPYGYKMTSVQFQTQNANSTYHAFACMTMPPPNSIVFEAKTKYNRQITNKKNGQSTDECIIWNDEISHVRQIDNLFVIVNAVRKMYCLNEIDLDDNCRPGAFADWYNIMKRLYDGVRDVFYVEVVDTENAASNKVSDLLNSTMYIFNNRPGTFESVVGMPLESNHLPDSNYPTAKAINAIRNLIQRVCDEG